MSDTIGRISVPAPTASGLTFPLISKYGYGETRDYLEISHRFQAGATLATQRFIIGSGARRFQFAKDPLTITDRATLLAFYNTVQGSFQTFTYNAPNPDRSTTTPYSVIFDGAPLSFTDLANRCQAGISFIEIVNPASAPSYTVTSTVTRFPSSGLASDLLSQTQQLIPLLHIKVRDPGVPDVYLSDRRVTVGGQLYLPRVLNLGEPGQDSIMTQDISGRADNVQITLGNADRAMSAFCQDTTLKYASIDLSFLWVNPGTTNGIVLQFWAGTVINYKLDSGPTLPLQCSDGVYALTQAYPKRSISRQDWKTFNQGSCTFAANGSYLGNRTHVGGTGTYVSGTTYSQYAVVNYNFGVYVSLINGNVGNQPDTHPSDWALLTCDYFFNSANGCLSHGMSPFFGGQPSFPQSVMIKDDGTGVIFGFGRSTVNSTSIVSDSMWGQPLADIWCNDNGDPQQAFWAAAIIAAVRDESTFEDVLGIVGAGPIGQYEGMSVQTNPDGYMFLVCPLADGFPPQGFQVNGNFQVTKYQPTYGLREVVGNDPVTITTDAFSLGQGGGMGVTGFTPNLEKYDIPDPTYSNILTGAAHDILPFAAGTAFVELRYAKPAGTGIAPTTAESHSMSVPIARGLTGITFDASGNPSSVPGLVNNAWVAMNTYLRALGLDQSTTAAQLNAIVLASFFTGTGTGAAEICDDLIAPIVGTAATTYLITATGQAISGNINVPAATFTYQTVLTIAAAATAGYIEFVATNLYSPTQAGLDLFGQVIQPTSGGSGDPGSFTYPTVISLSAAVSAGYCTLSASSGLERQWQFQGTIAESRPLRDHLISILNSCLGYFTFEFGRLKVGLRNNASAVTSFSAGNMLYQSLVRQSSDATFEYLKLSFANVALQYQLDEADYQDKDYSLYMGRPGAPLTSILKVPGISTLSQGLRYAATRVREEIGGVLRPDQANPYVEFDNNDVITFKTTIMALDTEVGDVIEVTHPDLPTYPGPVGGSPLTANTWKYRIIRWTLHKDWSITIVAQSVTDSMYDLEVGPKPADVPTTSAPILFYSEPLGEWAPFQIQASAFDPAWPSEWTFDTAQVYKNMNGVLAPYVSVTAHLPVNQFIPNAIPVVAKQGTITQSTTGGTLPGGTTYRVQLCAANAAGQYTPPSEVVLVKVPSGTNTNQFSIAGVQWPAINGLTKWVLFASDDDDLICGQATGSLTQTGTGPYTYSPTTLTYSSAPARSTYGVPNVNLATYRVKAKRLIHGGVEGLLVTGVSTSGITCAGSIDVTATDNWVGRMLFIIGRAPAAGPAPYVSFSCSSFNPATGFFGTSTNPLSTVAPVYMPIQVGDTLVVGFAGYDNSATPYVLADAGIANATNGFVGETVNDPNRIGNQIRVIRGTSRGATAKIVSNIATAYTLDRQVIIDSTSAWIVEVAAWETNIDTVLNNADPTAATNILLPIANYPGLPVLVGASLLDGQGNESDDTNIPVRMLYIQGGQIPRLVTASTTQLPTDGTLICDPTAATGPTAITVGTGGISSTALILPISDGTNVTNGTNIGIDLTGTAEIALVQGGGGVAGPTNLTVARAQQGTAAAAHSAGVSIALPGNFSVQLLAGAVASSQKLAVQNIATGINYIKVLPGGSDTLPSGASYRIVLAGTTYFLQLPPN